jgi:hypothetical protein
LIVVVADCHCVECHFDECRGATVGLIGISGGNNDEKINFEKLLFATAIIDDSL